MATAPASLLVAVDANVLMDLGAASESVLDALATIRQRLRSPQIILPPTAKQELIHIAQAGDTAQSGRAATKLSLSSIEWRRGPGRGGAFVLDCPSPRSSPHSFVAGRGRRKRAAKSRRDWRRFPEIL